MAFLFLALVNSKPHNSRTFIFRSWVLLNFSRKKCYFHLIFLVCSTKVIFLWEQSQDIRGFPAKKNRPLWAIWSLPIRGLFFGRRSLELMPWVGSQKKLTLAANSSSQILHWQTWDVFFKNKSRKLQCLSFNFFYYYSR